MRYSIASATILQLRETVSREAVQDPKIAEFDLLGSGSQFIGVDGIDEPLFAETLNIPSISECKTRDEEVMLQSVVAVHRLRAVTCLYGFTRLEPAATYTEEMLEDVRLTVAGAPLSEAADWLPAMEQLGEGIFLKVRPEAVRAWLKRQAVRHRGDGLHQGTQHYAARHKIEMQFPGLPYILLHSLSHALMEEIALDCGYPLSSLKERVYAVIACGQVKPALSVTGAQWQRMRSITKNPMLATHLGRMGFLGELTAEEVACGEKIGRVYGAFDKALGRRRFARSPGYELGRGRSADGEETEVETERTATAIKRMTFLENEIEAVAALIFPGLRGQLELLCVEDELPTAGVMPLVKRALAALAGPLGIRAAMARRKPDNTRAERDRN